MLSRNSVHYLTVGRFDSTSASAWRFASWTLQATTTLTWPPCGTDNSSTPRCASCWCWCAVLRRLRAMVPVVRLALLLLLVLVVLPTAARQVAAEVAAAAAAAARGSGPMRWRPTRAPAATAALLRVATHQLRIAHRRSCVRTSRRRLVWRVVSSALFHAQRVRASSNEIVHTQRRDRGSFLGCLFLLALEFGLQRRLKPLFVRFRLCLCGALR